MDEIRKTSSLKGKLLKYQTETIKGAFRTTKASLQAVILHNIPTYSVCSSLSSGLSGSLGQRPEELTSWFSLLTEWLTKTFIFLETYFVTAFTYIQLSISITEFHLLVYFASSMFPESRKSDKRRIFISTFIVSLNCLGKSELHDVLHANSDADLRAQICGYWSSLRKRSISL